MTEPDYLSLLCSYLEIDPDKIMSHRVYQTEIVAVIDLGIKGGRKVRVQLSDLRADLARQQQARAAIEPEPVTAEPKPRRGRK